MKARTREVKRGVVGCLKADSAETIIRYMKNCHYLSISNLERCAKAWFENKEKGIVKGLDWELRWDETGAFFFTDKAHYVLTLDATMTTTDKDGNEVQPIKAEVV